MTAVAPAWREKVRYVHLELPRHDVLLAEGLPCESFLDTGNRAAFGRKAGGFAPSTPTKGGALRTLYFWGLCTSHIQMRR